MPDSYSNLPGPEATSVPNETGVPTDTTSDAAFPGRLHALADALTQIYGSRGDAIGVAAVAGMETRGAWASSNSVQGCYMLRLGWELGVGPSAPNGRIPPSAWHVPEIQSWLMGNNPRQKPVVTNPDNAGGMLVVPGLTSDEAMAQDLFYVIMTARAVPGLQLFSQGATQMHLLWCGKRPQWPASWRELWMRHTLRDKGYWQAVRSYLGKGGQIAFPAGSGDEATELAWCVNQTGNIKTATPYYNGTPPFAGRGVKGYANDLRS